MLAFAQRGAQRTAASSAAAGAWATHRPRVKKFHVHEHKRTHSNKDEQDGPAARTVDITDGPDAGNGSPADAVGNSDVRQDLNMYMDGDEDAGAMGPLPLIQRAMGDMQADELKDIVEDALRRAYERVQKQVVHREAYELEAEQVYQHSITLKEDWNEAVEERDSFKQRLDDMEAKVTELQQLRVALEDRLYKLQMTSVTDALASIDAPQVMEAASMGDWDSWIDDPAVPVMPGEGEGDDLTDEQKALDTLQANLLEVSEKIVTLQREVGDRKTSLNELSLQVEVREARFTEANAAVESIMQHVQGAVHSELETKKLYENLKQAATTLWPAEPEPRAQPETDVPSPKPMLPDLPVVSPAAMTIDSPVEVPGVEPVVEVEQRPPTPTDAQPAAGAGALPREDDATAVHVAVALAIAAAAAAAVFLAIHVATQDGAMMRALVEGLQQLAQGAQAMLGAFAETLQRWLPSDGGDQALWSTLTILATSVITVPAVIKFLPGGSATLGFLLGGAIIGPHGLGLICDVEPVRHLAEMGVVFLLFNIGLELSLERLQAMAKSVFGLGFAQFALSTLAIAGVAVWFAGYSTNTALLVGGALALSSTAVAMNVLQERNETGSRHGRATFAVLLFQDLAVVVLLMLVPLLATGGNGGTAAVFRALGHAAIKAVLFVTGIIIAGRTLLRPLFRRIASLENPEMFAATTLFVVIGSSLLTQLAGLSLALGAFLAGLLMAETEYVVQVESDIAPFKGLLMGLFFISVGMEMSVKVLMSHYPVVLASLAALVVGKALIVTAVGQPFGLSRLSALRAGLYLAPGGEFAFVVLKEVVEANLLPASHIPIIFLFVVASMAMTPYLATLGQKLGEKLVSNDYKMYELNESETGGMKNHVIIMGYGRVGKTIAQLLADRQVSYVAIDSRPERVADGQRQDDPVYYGDAGSPDLLKKVGAEHASCAVITLDNQHSNTRVFWAMKKLSPDAKIFVRAHDVEHGRMLEKGGATAVVPEFLEPSLQLAAAVLGSVQENLSAEDIEGLMAAFRKQHAAELSYLMLVSGGSSGYASSGKPTMPDSSSGPCEPIEQGMLQTNRNAAQPAGVQHPV